MSSKLQKQLADNIAKSKFYDSVKKNAKQGLLSKDKAVGDSKNEKLTTLLKQQGVIGDELTKRLAIPDDDKELVIRNIELGRKDEELRPILESLENIRNNQPNFIRITQLLTDILNRPSITPQQINTIRDLIQGMASQIERQELELAEQNIVELNEIPTLASNDKPERTPKQRALDVIFADFIDKNFPEYKQTSGSTPKLKGRQLELFNNIEEGDDVENSLEVIQDSMMTDEIKSFINTLDIKRQGILTTIERIKNRMKGTKDDLEFKRTLPSTKKIKKDIKTAIDFSNKLKNGLEKKEQELKEVENLRQREISKKGLSKNQKRLIARKVIFVNNQAKIYNAMRSVS